MKLRPLYLYTVIALFVSMLAAPVPTFAWTNTAQQVSFVNAQGITLTGWLFKPIGNGPFPAVVMMHGCNGIFSFSDPTRGIANMYREWGDRLVSAGYTALLVDSFTPRKAAQNQCGNGITGVSEVNDRPYDAYAGLKYLASRADVSGSRIGLLGWSHGGSASMMSMDTTKYNTTNNFKVAAAFYPGCGLYDALGAVKNSTWKPYAPITILIGSADTVVSVDYCTTRVSKAQALGAANVSIAVFQNAKHSFDGAVKVANGFTQADVDAKNAADIQVTKLFATYLR